MPLFNWSRWLKSLRRNRIGTVTRKRPRSILRVEELESRVTPATFHWNGAGGDNLWTDAKNWVGNVAPTGNGDDLVFDAQGAGKLSTDNNFTGGIFNSITINYGLSGIGNGYTLSGNKLTLAPIVVGGGNLIVNNNAANAVVSLNIVMGGLNGLQFFTVNSGADLTFSGQLSEAAGSSVQFTKSGLGTLIVNNDNSAFTGPADIKAGVVEMQNFNTSLGLGQITVETQAQLQLLNITGPINENLLLNGQGPVNDGALLNVAGNNAWAGAITLDSDSTISAASATTLTISGSIGDTSGQNTTVNAINRNGEVIFATANTYHGNTLVDNGVLDIQNGLALGNGSAVQFTTTVKYNAVNSEFATLQLDSATGMTVANEKLIVNGPGAPAVGLGALYNLKGNNIWSGPVVLGSLTQAPVPVTIGVAKSTILTISGVISDTPGIPGFLTKDDVGTLIFTSANTYADVTDVAAGILEIEDSNALGTTSAGTNVFGGATLELAVDNLPDSVTGTINSLLLSEPLTISGNGVSIGGVNVGALYSHTGYNTWATPINIAGAAAIGVDADPNAISTQYDINPLVAPGQNILQPYSVTDQSLTITGDLTGGTLSKVGLGQLVLPYANDYLGNTNIQQGYVTIEDSGALGPYFPQNGPDSQSVVTVANGAALHLLPIERNEIQNVTVTNATGGTYTLTLGAKTSAPINWNAPATGPNSVQAALGTVLGGINNVNVTSVVPSANTIIYTITFVGALGFQSQPLMVANFAGLTPAAATVGVVRVQGGSNGVLSPTHEFNLSGNGISSVSSNYAPIIGTGVGALPGEGGALMNLSGNDSVTGNIVLNGQVGIGVEQVFSNNNASTLFAPNFFSQLTTMGEISDGATTGGINKLGSQRMIVQGDGTYGGPVDIQNGVLRVQSDSALGTALNGSVTTTTVEAGAALELGATLPTLDGGINAGIQLANEHLILNGSGNATFGDAPLVNLNQTDSLGNNLAADNMVRGPVTLNTDASAFNVTFTNAGPQPTLVADGTNLTGTNATAGVLALIPGTTSPAVNAVQTVIFGGTVTGGSFNLSFNFGAPVSVNYSTNATTLQGNIQAALDQIVGPGATVVTATGASAGFATVTFQDNGVQPTMTANTVGLTGTNPTLNIATTTTGTATTPAVQTITFGGTITGGTFTLTLGNNTTPTIFWSSDPVILANNIQNALANTPTSAVITFSSNGAQPTLIADPTNLTGISPSITPTTTTPGTINTPAVQTLTFGGQITGGTFTLNLGGNISGPIPWSNDPATLSANILAALSAFGNVVVNVPMTTVNGYGPAGIIGVGPTSPAGGWVTIAFPTPGVQPLMVVDSSGLSGNNPVINISTTTVGTALVPAVQTLTFGGTITGGTFTLSLSNNVSPAITWSANPATLAANILAALTAAPIALTPNPTVEAFGPTGVYAAVDIRTGTRLNIFGAVDDAFNQDPNGSDLTVIGTGNSSTQSSEMNLSGTSSYHGTTYIGTGMALTIGNGQALGSAGNSETQALTVNGFAGTFTLTFNGFTTVAIPVGAPATGTGSVQEALQALSSVSGVGGTVSVVPNGNIYNVTFGGNLSGFHQALMSVNVVTGSPDAVVSLATDGGGGTVVANGASIELAANTTVAGEPVIIQGQGLATVDPVPVRWFQMGPSPILNDTLTPNNQSVTGRTTSIAVDNSDPTGNTQYITTADGGAWMTRNGGKTWLPLFDAQINGVPIYAGYIAVDPANPNILYLGTGEANNSPDSYAGTGVYMSTNAGQTWSLLTNPAGNPIQNPLKGAAVNKILVANGFIFVATSDLATNGTQGNAGVWRFDPVTGWFNMTAGLGPVDDPSALAAGAPKWAVNNRFPILFPSTGASYTDLSLMGTVPPGIGDGGFLFMALGTASGPGSPFFNNNAVYYCSNPAGLNPQWFIGNFRNIIGNPFAMGGGPTVSWYGGNIRFTIVPTPGAPWQDDGSIYVAVSNSQNGSNNLLNVYHGTWGLDSTSSIFQLNYAVVAGAPNFLGNEGLYSMAAIASDSAHVYFGGQGAPLPGGAGQANEIVKYDGAAWTDLTLDASGNGPHISVHGLAFAPGNKMVAVTDGGVWTKNLATGAWTNSNGNLPVTQFHGIAVDPSNLNIALGAAQTNNVEQLNNGAWTAVDNAFQQGNHVIIDPQNSSVMFDVMNDQAGYRVDANPPHVFLRKSTDGGKTWNEIYPNNAGIDTENSTALPVLLDPVNDQRLLVGNTDGAFGEEFPEDSHEGLWESLDQGTTWHQLFFGQVSAIAAGSYQGAFQPDLRFADDPASANGANNYVPGTIYLVINGGNFSGGDQIWLTKDHGITWVQAANLPLNLGSIYGITVDPTNENNVYVVRNSNDGKGVVFNSTDAGKTWTDISANLPKGVPVWKLVLDPRNGSIYVGTDIGVYTLVGGLWSRFGTGMPLVQVKDLVLNQSLNTLSAGTYGRSMFTLYLDATLPASAGGAALTAVSGNAVWTGPVVLDGPTLVSASGSPQSLQNGLFASTLNIVGSISDQTFNAQSPLTKIGFGNVILSGASTYSGVTDIQQGILIVRNPLALGAATNGTTVEPSTALELQSSINDEPLFLKGDGIAFNGINTGALRNSSNNNTYSGPITLVTNSTIGVDSGTTLNISNTIGDNSQGFSLTKEETGTLVLSPAYTVTFSKFGVQLPITADPTNLTGTSPAITVATTTPGTAATSAVQTITFGGTITGGTFTLTFNGQTTSPAITWNSNAAILENNIQTALSTLTTIGTSVDPVTVGFAPSTYGGGTLVNQGILVVTYGTGLGKPINPSTMGTTVPEGSQLQLSGGISVPSQLLTISGTGIFGTGALEGLNGNNSWAGPVTMEALQGEATSFAPTNFVAFNTPNSTDGLTIGGAISELDTAAYPFFGLVKIGAGSMTLQGVDTYSGDTFVGTPASDGPVGISANLMGGTLDLQNGQALGNAAVTEVQTVTVSGIVGSTFNLNFNGAITPQMPFNDTAGDVQTQLNKLATIGGVGGAVSVTSMPVGPAIQYTVTFGGSLEGLSQPQLQALPFAGATVATAIATEGHGGVYVVNGAELDLDGGVTGINVTGKPVTLGGGTGASGNGVLYNRSGVNVWGGDVNLITDSTLGVNASSSLDILSPVGQGANPMAVNVTKTGLGTLELDADAGYTGTTTISAGTLLADGPQSGANTGIGPVIMNGGTLGGVGSFAGIAAAGTGTVAPGQTTGILTSSKPVTLPTTFFEKIVSTASFGQLSVQGAVNLNSAKLAGAAPNLGNVFGQTFTIITATGNITGNFALGLPGVVFISAQEFQVVITNSGATHTVVLTHVANTFTPPVINPNPIANQGTTLNTPVVIHFTVHDGNAGAAASALTVTATSSNQLVVSDASMTVVNNNGTCTLTIPANLTTGLATITVTVTDPIGLSNTPVDSFVLTVGQAPAITSLNNATFAKGTPGSFTVTATGFPAPTFSETGALPGGVTLSAGGVLSGTPTAGGIFNIVITASNGISPNATQNFTLTVDQPPAFTSAAGATFVEGVFRSFTVTAVGPPAPALSINGALPSGVTFNPATGALSGTPAAGTTGTYPLVFTANNGINPNATQNFTLTVGQTPVITSPASTTFVAGSFGTFTVTAAGSPTPTLSESGALPSGVTFDNTTGILSGTPAAGTGKVWSITFTASNGSATNATQNFTLTVDEAASITSAASVGFAVGKFSTFSVTTAGFPAPTLSKTGTLPSGVTFNALTGVLSGTPAAGTGGAYPLTFTAHNGIGADAVQNFTLTVGQAPAITSAASTTFVVGTLGSFTVVATGTPAPTITETGALPSGVTFSGGVLSGTPAAGTAGTYPITFSASNGIGSPANQNFTLTVKQAPQITSANNTTFAVGSFGTFTVTATGSPAPTFSLSGALPKGLSFNTTTGVLSGTPAAGTVNTYNLVFTASNGALPNATQNFTLTVAPAFAFSPGISNQSVSHQAGSLGLNGASNKSPATYALSILSASPAFPGSASINSSTGQITISGFSLYAGTIQFKETATFGVSTISQTFTVTVTDLPPNLSPIPNTTMTHGGTKSVPLTYSDPEGDPVTLSFSAVNPLIGLENKLQLYAAGPASNPYYFNLYHKQEKWLKSRVNGNWYGIISNGNVYAFSGSPVNPFGTFVGNFGPSIYTNPTQITNPQNVTVNLSQSGTNLIINLSSSPTYTGPIQITVTASNGILSTSQTFLVTVT